MISPLQDITLYDISSTLYYTLFHSSILIVLYYVKHQFVCHIV